MNAFAKDIQISLLGAEPVPAGGRHYLPFLSAVENQKGVLDVDTVKGCTNEAV